MAATLRHIFILLFALLQLVAPLLHAHTDRTAMTGLHLYELEHFTSPQNENVLPDALHCQNESTTCIVSIGDVIKHQVPDYSSFLTLWAYLPSACFEPPLLFMQQKLMFSVPAALLFLLFLLKAHTSRAPPLVG